MAEVILLHIHNINFHCVIKKRYIFTIHEIIENIENSGQMFNTAVHEITACKGCKQ